MDTILRSVNKNDQNEMRFIAEIDARIPLEFDSTYKFAEPSINSRLDYYKQLAEDDFFEVASSNNSIIAFHIIKKFPHPPSFQAATITSLWVHPDFRGKGLAAELKKRGEIWAKAQGLIFIQTNVHKNNLKMMELNQRNGYEPAYILLRKSI